MVSPNLNAWVVRKLRESLGEMPGLLAGPDTPTPEYQAWEAGVKRALHTAFGDHHAFTTDFETLTMVFAAGSVGRRDVSGSWRSLVDRNTPHDVLRRAQPLLRDALDALGVSEDGGMEVAALEQRAATGASVPAAPASASASPGPCHRGDALVLEPTADHFALLEPACRARHVDVAVAAVAAAAAP
jgi:hypothetical protein